MPGAGWGGCCDCSREPGTAGIPLALPLTTGPPPRTLRAGVTGGNTTFSRLASGHSVSIQSVATSPIRLSPLAMFLWGQWGGGRDNGVSRGRAHRVKRQGLRTGCRMQSGLQGILSGVVMGDSQVELGKGQESAVRAVVCGTSEGHRHTAWVTAGERCSQE